MMDRLTDHVCSQCAELKARITELRSELMVSQIAAQRFKDSVGKDVEQRRPGARTQASGSQSRRARKREDQRQPGTSVR